MQHPNPPVKNSPKMTDKIFILQLGSQDYWIQLSNQGTNLDVTIINTATGEQYSGTNTSLSSTIFAAIEEYIPIYVSAAQTFLYFLPRRWRIHPV
jgi:hypothetical protein